MFIIFIQTEVQVERLFRGNRHHAIDAVVVNLD